MALLYQGDRPCWYWLSAVDGGLALVVHAAIADELDFQCMKSPKLEEIQADPRIGEWQLFTRQGWGCGNVGAFDVPRPKPEGNCWIPFGLPYPNMSERKGRDAALNFMATLTVALDWLNRNEPDWVKYEIKSPVEQPMLIQAMCTFHGYNLAVDASPAFRQWLSKADSEVLGREIEVVIEESSQLIWPSAEPAHRMSFSLHDGAPQLIAERFALNPDYIGSADEGFTAATCGCDMPNRTLIVYRILAALSDRFIRG